jgi:hypothetical protein
MVFFDCPPIQYQDINRAHKENKLCYWNYDDVEIDEKNEQPEENSKSYKQSHRSSHRTLDYEVD